MFLRLLSNTPFPADEKFSPKVSPSAGGGDGGRVSLVGARKVWHGARGRRGAPEHPIVTKMPRAELVITYSCSSERCSAAEQPRGDFRVLAAPASSTHNSTIAQKQSTGQHLALAILCFYLRSGSVPGSPRTSLFPRYCSLIAY